MKTMAAMEDKLVEMEEIRDSLSVGFLPDYYMTEFSYPKSASAKKQKELFLHNHYHHIQIQRKLMAVPND